MLLAESEGDLQRVVNEFYSVCKRRKLKVNAGKSKVTVFERREEEVIDFNRAYWIRLPLTGLFPPCFSMQPVSDESSIIVVVSDAMFF